MADRSKGENLAKATVLVTGATGFVGRFLCERLLSEDFAVRGTILESESSFSLVNGVEPVTVEPLGAETPWSHALEGINTIIHLAARVHIMNDPSKAPITEYRKVNVEGTAQLAREATKAGVKRLVFVSSIKVNGEETDVSYTEESPAKPTDPYGISKWEAEVGLRQIEAESGLEVVIVRPTLVYGPGVKANFLKMLNTIQRGIPLPFASITNKRSLLYVGSLADALTTCATHPAAAGKTYLVSDGEDVSTPELISQTAKVLGAPARVFPFPVGLMKLAAKLINRTDAIHRLTGSLTVDSSKIRRDLEWSPPYTMAQGLQATANWFKSIPL